MIGSQLDQKTILITGASSGLGEATARFLAKNGSQIALCDIAVERGEALAKEICDEGGRAHFFPLNVTSEDEVKTTFAKVKEELGAIHVAVNNAGVDHALKPLADLDGDMYHRVMDINVKGVWLCMKYEIEHMIAQGGGQIINVASVAGLRAAPLMSIYSASKFAVVGLTKTAAREYVKQNIRINAVCPAVIRTPMAEHVLSESPEMFDRILKSNPMRRLGEPIEVASTIAWLCSDHPSFITGETFAIDGGLTA
ncbi:MAG: glucose 1-dehydrogenase [Planctomycetota bacterium]|nr:glucose 1-dehydrogenase [Planctomycetota bacterium]